MAPGDVEPVWDERAEQVHGIKMHKLEDAAPAASVDERLSAWVRKNSEYKDRTSRIFVGWNVAGFDVPFVREYLPKTAAEFSYRTVDLNAILHFIVGVGLVAPTGSVWSYDSLKAYVKTLAGEATKSKGGWHSAGFDAEASMHAFYVLQEILRRAVQQ